MERGDDRESQEAPGREATEENITPEPRTHLGPDGLRAYALVYCSLAIRADTRPAETTMEAVRSLLTKVTFEPEEPGVSRTTNGYSSASDTLWFKHYQVLFHSDKSGVNSELGTQDLLFYEGRTLDRKLRSFARSESLHNWVKEPVQLESLPEKDKDAVMAILGPTATPSLPFRGFLLIGHDKEREGHVFRLGVRQQRWLADESQEDRLPWLQCPPDIITPISSDIEGDDLSSYLPGPPVVERFVGEPLALRSMSRALLTWHANQAPDPWHWRSRRQESRQESRIEGIRLGKDRVLACFLPYLENPSEAAEQLRAALVEPVRCTGMGPNATLLVVGALSLEDFERGLGTLMSAQPRVVQALRIRVVDRNAIEAMARRYPWVWDLELTAVSEGESWSHAATASCFSIAGRLFDKSLVAESLAAIRWLIAFPWSQTPADHVGELVSALVELASDRPWTMLADVFRALRPEFHRDWYGAQDRDLISITWWVTLLPKDLLEMVPDAAWDPPPPLGSREWHSFVRLLRCLRGANIEVAQRFFNGLLGKLRERDASTDVLDAAWADSRPPYPGAGFGLKPPDRWGAGRMPRD